MSRLPLLGYVLATFALFAPARAETEASPIAALRVLAQPSEGGPRSAVRSDTTLKQRDRVQVMVTVWQSAYVHVLHLAPNGDAGILLRSARALHAGQSVRLPSGGAEQAYVLDDRTGREFIAVLASEAPLASVASALDDELRYVAAHGRLPTGSALADAIDAELAASAPAPAGLRHDATAPKHDRAQGVLDLLGPTRGTREGKNGAVLVYPGARGVALAVVSFEHVR